MNTRDLDTLPDDQLLHALACGLYTFDNLSREQLTEERAEILKRMKGKTK